MPAKKTKTILQVKWLKAFLDESNKTTFFNRTQSAKAVGYKGNEKNLKQCGYNNYSVFAKEISQWLDENGLSKAKLKEKEMRLLDATETKFIKVSGLVEEDDLPENVKIISETNTTKYTKDGSSYTETETLLAITVLALETQRRTLEMAKRGQGMYEKENNQIGRVFLNAKIIRKKEEDE